MIDVIAGLSSMPPLPVTPFSLWHPRLSSCSFAVLTDSRLGDSAPLGGLLCQYLFLWALLSWLPAVLPFSKLSNFIFGYFDPENVFLDNENK